MTVPAWATIGMPRSVGQQHATYGAAADALFDAHNASATRLRNDDEAMRKVLNAGVRGIPATMLSSEPESTRMLRGNPVQMWRYFSRHPEVTENSGTRNRPARAYHPLTHGRWVAPHVMFAPLFYDALTAADRRAALAVLGTKLRLLQRQCWFMLHWFSPARPALSGGLVYVAMDRCREWTDLGLLGDKVSPECPINIVGWSGDPFPLSGETPAVEQVTGWLEGSDRTSPLRKLVPSADPSDKKTRARAAAHWVRKRFVSKVASRPRPAAVYTMGPAYIEAVHLVVNAETEGNLLAKTTLYGLREHAYGEILAVDADGTTLPLAWSEEEEARAAAAGGRPASPVALGVVVADTTGPGPIAVTSAFDADLDGLYPDDSVIGADQPSNVPLTYTDGSKVPGGPAGRRARDRRLARRVFQSGAGAPTRERLVRTYVTARVTPRITKTLLSS